MNTHKRLTYKDVKGMKGTLQQVKVLEERLSVVEPLVKVKSTTRLKSPKVTFGVVTMFTTFLMFFICYKVISQSGNLGLAALLYALYMAAIILAQKTGKTNWKSKKETFQNELNLLVEEERYIKEHLRDIEGEAKSRAIQVENSRKLQVNKEKVSSAIERTVSEFDKDKNGVVDVVEAEDTFSILVRKRQKTLIEKEKEFNKPYLHDFVKLGKYLTNKKTNLQTLFEYKNKLDDASEVENLTLTLRDEVQTLNLLTICALDMLVALIEDDRINFYNIYENLDKLNIFNSNYENEMLVELGSLNTNITTLDSNMKSHINKLTLQMRSMSYSITDAIDDLSYRTEDSAALLIDHLEDINSTMKVGNTLSAINLYQNYKTNKRLKG